MVYYCRTAKHSLAAGKEPELAGPLPGGTVLTHDSYNKGLNPGGNYNSGRKSELTPAVIATIVNAIRSGAYQYVAARAAGVAPGTLTRWLSTEGPEYDELRAALAEADAEGEIRAIAIINKAALDDWRAAAWFAERRYKDRWGKTQVGPVVNVNTTEGNVLVLEMPVEGRDNSDIIGAIAAQIEAAQS